MKDIVKRLRIECTHDCPTCRNNAIIAADEIERLRTRLAKAEELLRIAASNDRCPYCEADAFVYTSEQIDRFLALGNKYMAHAT